MWLKRISAPGWWPIKRKTHKFVTTVRGPHADALPLQVLVRDIFELADTAREARQIIRAGNVLVDGRAMKDIKFGVGSMDVVEIPSLKKAWRAVPKNGLTFIEISGHESKVKLCKITDKKMLKGAKTQLNLSDGRNILTDANYSTQDSIVIEVPSQKVVNHIKFEKGNLAYVATGKNSGAMGKIKEIDKPNRRVWLESKKETFEVPIKSIMMIGKEEPLVKLE